MHENGLKCQIFSGHFRPFQIFVGLYGKCTCIFYNSRLCFVIFVQVDQKKDFINLIRHDPFYIKTNSSILKLAY